MFSLSIFKLNEFFGSKVGVDEGKNVTNDVTKYKAEKIAFEHIKKAEKNINKIENEIGTNSKNYHLDIESEMKYLYKRLDGIKNHNT